MLLDGARLRGMLDLVRWGFGVDIYVLRRFWSGQRLDLEEDLALCAAWGLGG